MSYAIQGTASQLKPGREEPLKRAAGIPVRPEAGTTSTASPTRRQSLTRIRGAWSHRRRPDGLPGPGSRASHGDGVSPIASGASRGVAILFSR
jgi:hypothetical protein